MAIKDRIKEKRIECGMTLEELAKIVGTSKQTIHKYESGIVSNIPSDKIEAMAKALHTTPAYLMGWSDMMIQTARDNKLNELIDFVANHDDGNYSYATGDETTDAIGVIISIMLNLDDGRQMELINYAKFLESQEKK